MTPPDSDLLLWLTTFLVQFGPVVLFIACMLETTVFIGLVVPVGGLIALSAMLSSRGVFEPETIVLAAVSGALLGDHLGFGIGRFLRGSSGTPVGKVGRIWKAALGRTQLLLQSRGGIGISAARGIPFVRTVMPWFAGRSAISWKRFAFFDFGGVLLWATIYLGGGFLAGEGWRTVAAEYGEVAGGAALLVLLVGWLLAPGGWLRRRISRSTESPDDPLPNPPT